MIITRLKGGLGNQLFQYAAARWLSVVHQTTLKLDTSAFENNPLREYSLSPYRIQEVFATIEEILKLKGTSKKMLAKIANRLSQKRKTNYNQSFFSELQVSPFDPNILKTPMDVFLSGYWQSEKYFIDIQDIIRREFTVIVEQDPRSREISEQIVKAQSISIHVRRCDYVTDPQTYKVHGICSLDYYKKSVALIVNKIIHPHFFVFSDDPDWITSNLHFDYPTTYVTHNNSSKSYEDLQLMSMCKHHIIANSSFSWWGAWLNPNQDKIVIAPNQWFKDPSIDTRDLIPDGWIKI